MYIFLAVGIIILLLLLFFQIFQIEFGIFMPRRFLQNLFIFRNRFFDFAAFGQSISLIVKSVGTVVLPVFGIGGGIITGAV